MDDDQRRARVRLLLRAADELAGEQELLQLLVASTGLSPEGVRWALDEHLERQVSEPELVQLLEGRFDDAAEVTVVLSANVFTAALRALVVAAVHGARVTVRSSRREPVFAPALIERAQRLGADWLELDATRAPIRSDAVHVYGRRETLAAIEGELPAGCALYAHGPGFSVLVIGEAAQLPEAARACAEDLAVFDQRGCLSPRLALVLGDLERGLAFSRELHHALLALEARVPRGALAPDERAELLRYQRAQTMLAAELHTTDHSCVVCAPLGSAPQLAPIGRTMHVLPLASGEEATALLDALAPQLTAVRVFGAPDLVLEQVPVAHGPLQRPPLTGPVDLRARRQG